MVPITYCGRCENILDYKIDGYIPACKAFPEGIPRYLLKEDVRNIEECNNGFKYKDKHPSN